jgi:hypothetical protein
MSYARPSPLVLLVGLCVAGPSLAREQDPGSTIRWPNAEHRMLQEAIAAARDGDTIQIAAGVYEISEPIWLYKDVTIQGSGTGQGGRGREQFTYLTGAGEWERVAKEPGDVRHAVGLLNYGGGGGGKVKDLIISGGATFDAAIKGDVTAGPAALVVEDTVIQHSDWGILWIGGADLKVQKSVVTEVGFGLGYHPQAELVQQAVIFLSDLFFQNLINHAVILVNSGGTCDQEGHLIKDVNISFVEGAGIVVSNGGACIVDSSITAASMGGIWSLFSYVWVIDSTLLFNTMGGILAWNSPDVLSQGNFIAWTQSQFSEDDPSEGGLLGDGIVGIDSEVFVWDNDIRHSNRAGVSGFGGKFTMGKTTITCSGFDIGAEPGLSDGEDVVFEDLGDVRCGCPEPDQRCLAKSSEIKPPPPVGGFE